MKEYLLAHDLGTSGNKATLFTLEGVLVKSVTAGYKTDYGKNNWVEQDPNEWWRAVCESSRELLAGIDAEKVASVAFSGQMMGCLPVDKSGVPLRNHILYCDQRSVEQEKEVLTKISQKEIFQITGQRLSASFLLTKILWIKKYQPDIYDRAYKFLQAKDYINFLLTGRMVTDYCDASGSNAFDLNTMSWSEKIIALSGIAQDKFPEAVPSATVVGEITAAAAAATGIKAGTPVVAGAADGCCATVGIGSVEPGITYNYLGSSSWISTTVTELLPDENMVNCNFAHPVEGYLQPCGPMLCSGSAYNWIKEQLAQVESESAARLGRSPYEVINEVIAGSPAGANGIIFLPHLLGERSPRWNPNAKGCFLGLSLESKRADIFRSVLEGITLNLNVVLDVFKAGVDGIKEVRVMGGGAQGAVWCQIMADIYDVEIHVPRYLEEATSMGAAIIGGVGVGALSSFKEVERFVEIQQITKPISENVAVYKKKKPIFDKAYYALEEAGVFDALAM